MAHLLSAPCDYVVHLLCRATAGTRARLRSLRADEPRQDHDHLLLRHQACHTRRHHLGHRGEERTQWRSIPRMGWYLQLSQHNDYEGGGGCFVQGFPTYQHGSMVAISQSPHKHRRTPISQHLGGDEYELYVLWLLCIDVARSQELQYRESDENERNVRSLLCLKITRPLELQHLERDGNERNVLWLLCFDKSRPQELQHLKRDGYALDVRSLL